jgi:hypothetical protein
VRAESDTGDLPPRMVRPGTMGVAIASQWWRLPSVRVFAVRALPAIIGLLPLVSLLWSRGLLFGEDALLFVHPFDLNQSPLVQYGYTANGALPVPDRTPYFYSSVLAGGLAATGLSAAAVEYVLVALGSVTASYGMFWLFRTLSDLGSGPAEANVLPAALGTYFYLVNPFTLSVIFWHAQNWDFFYALLPFILVAYLKITYSAKFPIDTVCVVLLIGIVLAPGTDGAFGASIFFVTGFFALLVLVRPLLFGGVWKTALLRLAGLISTGFGLVGWTFMAFLLSIQRSGLSAAAPSGLVAGFQAQTVTATPTHVLELVAFSWIYDVPGAYSWIGLLPYLAAAGAVVPILLAVALLKEPLARGLLPLSALAWLAACGAFAGNPPFGPLNLRLLELGGPFLVLINGYYFFGELYIVGVAVAIFHLTRRAEARGPAPTSIARPIRPPNLRGRLYEGRRYLINHFRGPRRARLRIVIVAVVLAVLAVFSVPFFTGQVYRSDGSNVSVVVLPDSFEKLHSLLASSGVSDSFLTLVLPMSSTSAQYTTLGKGSFTDSSLLVTHFIPGPVIWGNTTPLYAALDDYLASGASISWVPLLQGLHIGTVVVDPYLNLSEYPMSHAPNGEGVNLSALRAELNESLGEPSEAGEFQVYRVAGAIPLVSAQTALGVIPEPSLVTYLDLLGALNASSYAQSPWLRASVPLVGTAIPPTASEVPAIPYDGRNDTFVLPPRYVVDQLDFEGRLSAATPSPSSFVFVNATNTSTAVHVLPLARFGLANTTEYATTLQPGPPLSNPMNGSGGVTVERAFHDPRTYLRVSVEVEQLAANNWLVMHLDQGDLRVDSFVYLNRSGTQSNLGITAFYQGRPFEWVSLPLRPVTTPDRLTLGLWINRSAITAVASSTSGPLAPIGSIDLNAPSAGGPNEGENASNAPPRPLALSNWTPVLDLTNLAAEILGFNISAIPDLAYVIGFPAAASPRFLNVTAQMGYDGNFVVSFKGGSAGSSSVFLRLAYPPGPYWSARAGGASWSAVSTGTSEEIFRGQGVGPGYVEGPVGLGFAAVLNVGLFVSFGEVAAAVALLAYRRVRGRPCA